MSPKFLQLFYYIVTCFMLKIVSSTFDSCFKCFCYDCGVQDTEHCMKPTDETRNMMKIGKCVTFSWFEKNQEKWIRVVERMSDDNIEEGMKICEAMKLRNDLYKDVSCLDCDGDRCNNEVIGKKMCYLCSCDDCDMLNVDDAKCIFGDKNLKTVPMDGMCMTGIWLEDNGKLHVVRDLGTEDGKLMLECRKHMNENNICKTCTEDRCNNGVLALKNNEDTTIICYECKCVNCLDEDKCWDVSKVDTMKIGKQCYWINGLTPTGDDYIERGALKPDQNCDTLTANNKLHEVRCETCDANKCNNEDLIFEKLFRGMQLHDISCYQCNNTNGCWNPINAQIIKIDSKEKCFWFYSQTQNNTKIMVRGKTSKPKEICNEIKKRYLRKGIVSLDSSECGTCGEDKCNNKTFVDWQNINLNFSHQNWRRQGETSFQCYICSCGDCKKENPCLKPGKSTPKKYFDKNYECGTYIWKNKKTKSIQIRRMALKKDDDMKECLDKKSNPAFTDVSCSKNEGDLSNKQDASNLLEKKTDECYFCEDCPRVHSGSTSIKRVEACYTEIVERRTPDDHWVLEVRRATGTEDDPFRFLRECRRKKLGSSYRNVVCLKCKEALCNNISRDNTKLCYECADCYDTSARNDLLVTEATCLIETGRILTSRNIWRKYVLRNTTDDIFSGTKKSNLINCRRRKHDIAHFSRVNCMECHGDFCNGGPVGDADIWEKSGRLAFPMFIQSDGMKMVSTHLSKGTRLFIHIPLLFLLLTN